LFRVAFIISFKRQVKCQDFLNVGAVVNLQQVSFAVLVMWRNTAAINARKMTWQGTGMLNVDQYPWLIHAHHVVRLALGYKSALAATVPFTVTGFVKKIIEMNTKPSVNSQ
jgi:hypothetical protein